jgi:carbon-monoxide dehydrogenase large subunit
VFTGADYAADGLACRRRRRARSATARRCCAATAAPVIDRARSGDPVVMVIAQTLDEAKDAAELVEVDTILFPRSPWSRSNAHPAHRASGMKPDNISHTHERATASDRRGLRPRGPHRAPALRHHAVHAQYMNRGDRLAPTMARSLYALRRRELPAPRWNMLADKVFRVPESKMRVVCQTSAAASAPRAGSMSITD